MMMGYYQNIFFGHAQMIRIDYILELLKVVLTNITMTKIRYLGKIIKFCSRLVLFLELLLKIPNGLHANQNRNQS